jgi:hypothetical protein
MMTPTTQWIGRGILLGVILAAIAVWVMRNP